MTPTSHHHHGSPRARRAFWILTLVGVAAAGSLTVALGAPAGALTGLRVAASGLILIAALSLAARVAIFLERARRRDTSGGQRE